MPNKSREDRTAYKGEGLDVARLLVDNKRSPKKPSLKELNAVQTRNLPPLSVNNFYIGNKQCLPCLFFFFNLA
jgi:hypothetical protein